MTNEQFLRHCIQKYEGFFCIPHERKVHTPNLEYKECLTYEYFCQPFPVDMYSMSFVTIDRKNCQILQYVTFDRENARILDYGTHMESFMYSYSQALGIAFPGS